MKATVKMRIFLIRALVLYVMPGTLLANDPLGFFGLEFGNPIPHESIVTEDDPRFDYSLLRLGENERAFVYGSRSGSFGENSLGLRKDAIKIIQEEVPYLFSPYVVIYPPEPNINFDVYIAIVTPKTNVLGGIFAYGDFESCYFTIRSIGSFLLEKYSSLKATLLTSRFLEEEVGFVEIESEKTRVSLGCDFMNVANKEIERKAKDEMDRALADVSKRLEDAVDKTGF